MTEKEPHSESSVRVSVKEERPKIYQKCWFQLLAVVVLSTIILGSLRLYFVKTNITKCTDDMCGLNQHCKEVFDGVECRCNEGFNRHESHQHHCHRPRQRVIDYMQFLVERCQYRHYRFEIINNNFSDSDGLQL